MKRLRSDLDWYENLMRDILWITVIGILAFWSVITWAGGGYFEAPVVNGKCRPFMEPPKPWKRMYQQALAWRIIALIACADQQKGQQLARNMLFVSFPFVNPEAVKKIIEEYEPIAKESPAFDPLPQTQVDG